MNIKLTDWRKLIVALLLVVARILGGDIPDDVLMGALVAFFAANGLEWVGKGLAAKNGK